MFSSNAAKQLVSIALQTGKTAAINIGMKAFDVGKTVAIDAGKKLIEMAPKLQMTIVTVAPEKIIQKVNEVIAN